MDPLQLGILSFAAILVFVFVGLHVGVGLIIVAVVGLTVVRGFDAALSTFQYVPAVTVTNYNLAVFVLFILMGEFISVSGLATMLFDAAQAWLGRVRGGLGIAVTAMSAALGAVTGSSIAAAAMITRVAFPEMVKHKYDPATSAGIIAAVSPLAVIIPPSIFSVFYGVLTNVPVGKLLIAGLLPGFIIAVVYMVLIHIRARLSPEKMPPVERRFTWGERAAAVKTVTPIVVMMLIVIGGIYGGIFTPSEAGAAGSLIALIFLVIMRRRGSGRLALTAVWESASMSAMVYFLLVGSLLFARFMAASSASEAMISLIAGIRVSPYITFALVAVVYLILGCFLDALSMMAVTVPVTHPLMVTLGFDPIWFGMMVVILAGMATITPPFGMDVFTVKGIVGKQVELWAIFKAALPNSVAMVIVVILLTIFPQVVLILPSMMYGKG